jgi:hypothetical protein
MTSVVHTVEINPQNGTSPPNCKKCRQNIFYNQLIEEHFSCNLSEHRTNWAVFDLPNYLKGVAMEHIKDDNKREIAIKGILNSNLTMKITVEALKDMVFTKKWKVGLTL